MRLACLLLLALSLQAQRTTINLNGAWNITDSTTPDPQSPSASEGPRTAPVPGLAHLATPPFPDVDRFDSRELIQISIREKKLPESARTITAGIPRQQRNYFWYQRTFTVTKQHPIAMLRIAKAQFGTAVWLNGKKLGEHLGCFSAGYFDATQAINWSGENTLAVRIGAHPAAIPDWAPAGTDFEKYLWTPGIYDNVSLILTANPYIESVQIAPRLAQSAALIETTLVNLSQKPVTTTITHTSAAFKVSTQPVTLQPGERKQIQATLKMPGAKLWTPEEPNLHWVQATTTGDTLKTRFGLREFRFDTATKRAYLNGKLYFLRGSNVTLHRFFEDPLSKHHPWEEAWVRKLLVDGPKRMNWNSFRFCIGPAPEMWFDIADEAGLLIQNEFFIWNGREYFPPYKAEELITQYSEWMRDHWNHPSVAIWDASNETDTPLLRDTVIPTVRKLDLSNRPWDNGYAVPTGPDDPVEDHPYVFSTMRNPGPNRFFMTQLESMTGAKTTNAGHPSGHAVIANEYGWLWLNRDGTPTLLTDFVYKTFLGDNATPAERFDFYAYHLAGLTEFWRAHRNFAGVLHFTWLTCSYPGVKTSDHWKNVETLELEPGFADWSRESFKPLGLYINFWQPTLKPGHKRSYAVMAVNDLDKPAQGKLRLEFVNGPSKEVDFTLPAHGAHTWQISLDAPTQPGAYLLKATATQPGVEPTVSRRKVQIQ